MSIACVAYLNHKIQNESSMIGYAGLGTNDLPRAASFYDMLLAEMGASRVMEFGDRGFAWGTAMDKPTLCIMPPFGWPQPGCVQL